METNTSSRPHVHSDLVTCGFDVTESLPFGTIRLCGTATGSIMPQS